MISIKDYGRTPQEVKELGVEKWTTSEVTELFRIDSFAAPYVSCTRIRDGQKGTLEFSHSPRFYFNFIPAK